MLGPQHPSCPAGVFEPEPKFLLGSSFGSSALAMLIVAVGEHRKSDEGGSKLFQSHRLRV